MSNEIKFEMPKTIRRVGKKIIINDELVIFPYQNERGDYIVDFYSADRPSGEGEYITSQWINIDDVC